MVETYKSSEIADRIRCVSKEKNISTTTMFSEIGLGKNTLANFKTSMPKADNLARIADYLDVSVDYLLGREETKTEPVDLMTQMLIKHFNELSPQDKIDVLNFVLKKAG